MAKEVKTTKRTLNLLLSGKSALARKFAGKHVWVVKDKVVPLRKGEQGREDFRRLKKEYGQAPLLTFVPRPGISYILNCPWK